MIAKELINELIPSLSPTDSAKKAIKCMERLRINQLPVVENGSYKGLVTEEAILASTSGGNEKAIEELPLMAPKCYINPNNHFFAIIKKAYRCGINVIAVLDNNEQYIGVITVQDTIIAFAQTSAVQSSGGIIVLSLKKTAYSLREISRLIEAEGAKILASSIDNDHLDTTKVKLTLKINKNNLTPIIAVLEHFNYQVIALYEEANTASIEKERLGLLMNYLNV